MDDQSGFPQGERVLVSVGPDRPAGRNDADPAGVRASQHRLYAGLDDTENRDSILLAQLRERMGRGRIAGDNDRLDSATDQKPDVLVSKLADRFRAFGSIGQACRVAKIKDILGGQEFLHGTDHGQTTDTGVEKSKGRFIHWQGLCPSSRTRQAQIKNACDSLAERTRPIYKPDVDPIRYFNRHTGKIETEQVYGEGFLRWSYGNPLGAISLNAFVKRPFFSRWYGRRMSQPTSTARIAPFISQYGLDPADFADSPDSYGSFNDFFFRKLKPASRPIDPDDSSVVFPADGRHLGFSHASEIEGVFVKGQKFDLASMLGDRRLADQYENGSLVLSRLCPVDYHRFHFPAAGIPEETRVIDGPLFSVSPIALRQRLAYLWTNKRAITKLRTEPFGTVLLLEIGATCVGTIQQTFTPGKPVDKGAEKGYFAFGGSSTLTLFEPGAVTLEADLLENSARQIELYARIGSRMGHTA
jgi:phosphatidylserine decarboxylase